MKIALALLIVSVGLMSCQTPDMFNSHARDKNSVAPTELDRDVLMAAIMQQQTTLASKLDSNIEKGLVIKNKHRTVERDTTGEIIQIGDSVLYGESDIELRLSTFHELADKVERLELDVATKSTSQLGTNQVYATPSFDGLRLVIDGSGGAGLNSDNIRAPYDGRAAEITAKVDLLRAYWEGRTGYTATLLTTAGEQITGIIKEVIKVSTPAGAVVAAAELLIEKKDGTSEVVTTESKAK